MLPTLRSLALLGLIVATPALAQGPGPGHGGLMQRAMDQIELTADQRVQLEAVKTATRDAMQELRGEFRTNRAALGEAIEAGADDATVAGLARELHALHGEMRNVRKSAMIEARNLLTEEQKAELKALRAEHRGERGGSDVGGKGQRRGGPGF